MRDRILRSTNGASGPRLIVRNALAAQQWEAYYFDAAEARAAAWATPRLFSYRAWLNDAWRTTLTGDDPRALLTPEQSAALWRAVIEDSPAGRRLLDVRHAARWAADAHRLLADWNLSASDVRDADASPDTRAFLAWQQRYLERLADSGWLDEPELVREPRYVPHEAIALLDLTEPTPAQSTLLETLKSQGCAIDSRAVPTVECAPRSIARRDSTEELETAAEWARTRIDDDPHARLALIVPELASEPALVLRRIRRAFRAGVPADADMPALALARGAPLDCEPMIGAALGAIELASARATFATLSRWLRSPFFHSAVGQAQGDAAAAEAALRSELASQLPFLTAYERAGLARRLDALAPELGERLRAGLQELRTPRPAATPDVWARAWSRGLARLGWPAPGSGVNDVALRDWDEALTSFAQLTPIFGPCGQDTAIAQLSATIAGRASATRLPLHGLHVLARIDDVGPGYTGVWVTGVTDRSWPEPVRLNPLLPAELQIKRGMPRATPTDALARARASMARLLARTPEAVFSWPRVVHDHAAAPSPLLAGMAAVDVVGLGRSRARAAAKQDRPLALSLDPAPALTGARIPGGARTVDLQARCPIRAFCETRLDARELKSPAQGLSPRHQGIAAHRALELLFRRTPSQQALEASLLPASDAIAASVQRALTEMFGATRAALTALFELETVRLRALLRRFVEVELKRPPFRTVGVEERAEVRIGELTIACRLDRLDELADGTLALIDYKTGTSEPAPNWLDEPLTSPQVPLYALGVGSKLSALITVGLGGEAISYSGAAKSPGLVANTLREVSGEESWTAQIERWRVQIAALVEEYVGGDVRVYTEDWSDAAGAYAPLTRVYARAAFHPTGREP